MATEPTEPTERSINCFRVYRGGSQALMRPPGLRGNDGLDFTFIKNLSVGSVGSVDSVAILITSYFLHQSSVMFTGGTCQMSSQYSTMARSEENLPLRAQLSMDLRVHPSVSTQAVLTFSWASR
jgi:hypothetical protein